MFCPNPCEAPSASLISSQWLTGREVLRAHGDPLPRMVLGEWKRPCPHAVEVHVDPLPWPDLCAVRECFKGRQAAVSREDAEQGRTDTQTLGGPHLHPAHRL